MSEPYIAKGDPAEVKAIAEKYGFCLVRNVFSLGQILALESHLATEFEDFPAGLPDLYSLPSMRWVMLEPRVLAIAHALLGDQLVYYRETNLNYEREPGPLTNSPYTELHCDARGAPDNLHAPWRSDAGEIYPAYRFAVYFRNYRDHSGGLKVGVRSHVGHSDYFRQYEFEAAIKQLPKTDLQLGRLTYKVRIAPFELYNVPSVPGDLVIFNLRTFHSAGATRFRERPDIALLPFLEQALLRQASDPDVFLPIPEGSRNAIFFDYGAPSKALDLYIKWRALGNAAGHGLYEHLDSQPVAGIQIRNDGAIVALAKKLEKTLATEGVKLETLAALSQLSAPAGDLAARLLALCRTHVESSPYHRLFDVEALRATPPLNEVSLLSMILNGVRAVQAASDADDAALKAEARLQLEGTRKLKADRRPDEPSVTP